MVLRTLVLLGLLAGPAGAGCLPEGRTPKRVMFEDGQVVEGIRRDGKRLTYTSSPTPGTTYRTEALWGLYVTRISTNGPGTRYDWQGSNLPDPSDLVVGQPVVARAVMTSGDGRWDYSKTVRLIGPDSMEVAGCRYDVLRIAVREGTPEGPTVEGEIWLDPDRLVVWATNMRILGKGGKVEREQSSRAFAAD